MMAFMSSNELSLGAALRAWRDRVDPAAVGRPGARGRRVRGLRREDLADLAGLSVDYVVRLEQGRATHPSAHVAGALARALQLTVQERDHLYRLSGLQPPSRGLISEHIPPGLQRILNRLGDAPCAVFAADWQLIWWNGSWTAVIGDPRTVPETARSVVRARFPLDSEARPLSWSVFSDHPESTDRAIVADLRKASARYPGDPRLTNLIRQTLTGNARFAALWNEGSVGSHAEDRKTIQHLVVGTFTVDCDVLVDTDTDLKVVLYTAVAGSEDAAKLDLALSTVSASSVF